MKLHVLHCGSIRVSETVPFGDRISLRNTGRQLLAPESRRITLPVCCFLAEHPKGLILVDTGWCRAVSPAGVYDPNAVKRVLPPSLAAFYHPVLPAGMAVHEQLASMGIYPEDLSCVLLTHLDPDHTAGLRHLRGAKRVLVAEDEYYWSCRAVYKARQPWSLWMDTEMERFWYRGSPLGPNRWAFDLFGDESVQLVNVPGHTDGQAAVIFRSGGRFVLLAADSAFSNRNWEEMLTPGFGLFRARQLKSLEWIREMAADPGCAEVLCSHDPESIPRTVEF
ncbi:MAG: N-acyl homoserine lactonase family protein [Oscillospiraceae bacterium]|nr:N-acyl homoserine lactonase family protein [Oscillospiraceae bacterium]MBO7372972.1 N-acyl homoserine lactonase family protein [Oscillospiraceae bacterium]